MLNLPPATCVNKKIPKQKFYEHLEMTTALKRSFVEDVQAIHWRHKLAASSLNVAEGDAVKEIQVFEIALTKREFNEAVLKLIDKAIPYQIVYVLSFENKVQAWIAYKEATATSKSAFKVNHYYHTTWCKPNELILKLEGLTLDAIYENLVRQIAGDEIQVAGEDLKTSIAQSEARKKVAQEIARLEKQARTEKQPKKKFELVQRIRELKKDVETRSGEFGTPKF